jgi:fused signal recognition particle receptor
MALGFLKKVFSFGRKEVEQRPAEDEPLAPLNLDALKGLAGPAQTTTTDAPVAETANEVHPVEPPVATDASPPSPLRGGSVGEADWGGVVDEARDSLAPSARDIEEKTQSAAEVTPSGPSDHLPLEGGEEARPAEPEIPAPVPEPIPAPESEPEEPAPEVEPTPEPEPAAPEIPAPPMPSAAAPSPLEGEVPAEQAEGVVEDARDAHPSSPQSVDGHTLSTAEATPSGPSDHLPLKGGEEARPASPPPGQVTVGKAVEKKVEAAPPPPADEARDAHLSSPQSIDGHTPSAAAATPSGPSDHLPLKGGEEARPAAPPPGKVTVGKAVEKKVDAAPPPPAPEPRKSWFQRLRDGLSRSSRELTGSIAGIFTKRKLDEETLEELEDVLIRADLGMETALRVTDTLASSRYGKDVSDTEVRAIMAQEVEKVLAPVAKALELDLSHKPHVILVVGVNGTGKTTTIGKLAAKLSQGGLSVMLAAGDTFRAAAIEQLKIWGERTGSPVVSSKLGADAAGLAWDAFEKAREAGSDVLIIDTAGRLQNKAELMAELEKIVRVLGKHDPEAPHTVLQTVDATTGQNALNQVEIFRNVAGVNGLVMTKLDGTARGGILVAIAAKHKLPVYFIGVGEQVDDLEPFSASDFAKAIAGVG